MFKNVASNVALFAFDSTTGAPKTGDAANLTAYVAKDWGAVTVLADTSAAEMSATNAPGWYLFSLAQAETNADVLLFTGKSSTSDVVVVGMRVDTAPANFTSFVAQSGDSFARLGAPAGASIASDIANVSGGGGGGAGAITWVYTLTSTSGGVPIADADVWVSSDAAGVVVLASGRTDQNGQVTFYLDAGTVYVFRQKTGVNFNNPQTQVVTP